MALIYSLHSEILKLLYRRATHVVLFLILVFQTFLANIWCFSNCFSWYSCYTRDKSRFSRGLTSYWIFRFWCHFIWCFYYDYPRLNLRSRGIQRLGYSYKPPLCYKSKYFPSFKNISLAGIFFCHFLPINISDD